MARKGKANPLKNAFIPKHTVENKMTKAEADELSLGHVEKQAAEAKAAIAEAKAEAKAAIAEAKAEAKAAIAEAAKAAKAEAATKANTDRLVADAMANAKAEGEANTRKVLAAAEAAAVAGIKPSEFPPSMITEKYIVDYSGSEKRVKSGLCLIPNPSDDNVRRGICYLNHALNVGLVSKHRALAIAGIRFLNEQREKTQ